MNFYGRICIKFNSLFKLDFFYSVSSENFQLNYLENDTCELLLKKKKKSRKMIHVR